MPPRPAGSFLKSKRALFFIGLVAVLVLFAVFVGNKKPKEGMGGGRPQGPVLVSVAQVQRSTVPITINAIGTVEASETITVMPQVTGQLRRVHFRQGDMVRAGQLLFEIDSRQQQESVSQSAALLARSRATVSQSEANVAKAQAQVNLAQANLQRDLAQLELARTQEARYQRLLDQNYVTREQYEQTRTSLQTAQAAVSATEAALADAKAQVAAERSAVRTSLAGVQADQAVLDNSRITLGFTRITAPIAGKTGPLLVNAGNMVQAGASQLVTIERLNPVFVAFSIPEKELPSVQSALHRGRLPVTAKITSDRVTGTQSQQGILTFIDNKVDPTNGTVRLKATFENASHTLWPGRFTDVTLQLGVQGGAIVVPAEAVQEGQQGDFVYVVKNGNAVVRPVNVDRIADGTAVIQSGLEPGETVVRDGQLKLSPNARVRIARNAR